MIMRILLLVLAVSAPVKAEVTIQPKAKAAIVVRQIEASGASTQCACDEDDRCTIRYTPAPGVPVTFTNFTAIRAALIAELNGIEDSIDAGNETAAQRRRFMKITLILNGWNRN